MISYLTLENAAVALGRNLTWFETVWFDYSATKSDFYLYCHTILLPSLVFSIAPLPLLFAELTGWFDRFKIQPKIVGIRNGLPLPSFVEIVAQLVVYFLIEDYINYWIHRLLHCKWGYEKIHRVHNEYIAPTGYASAYAHWAEIVIVGIPMFLGPAVAPGHIVTFSLWIILRQLEAIENHSGYEFPWSLTKCIPFYGGANYHDYHHYVGGQSQCNFGFVFTYCDYIYGTDKGYRIHKKLLN